MRTLKKILTLIIVLVMITSILTSCNRNVISTNLQVTDGKLIKVGVLLYRFDDVYISLIRQSLENIQKGNEGKIDFLFFDGKNNQSIQDKSLDTLLQKGEVDLLLLNLVDTKSTKKAINKIKEKNIPVVLFNREPVDIGAIKSYNRAYFVGTNAAEAGMLQGKILINTWNTNKKLIDKNKDNTMQYIMLMGERDNIEAIQRTQYSISTINEAGIKTQQLSLQVCNWDEEKAKDITKSLFLQLGNKIEVIISNNDAMAIGAVKALQEQGYNNGNLTKTIPVIGIDAIPEAQELIKKGYMTGSVLQDAPTMAEAMYEIGMNLVYDKAPLDGTQYKFDDTGVAVRIHYKEYVYSPNAA